MAGWNQSKFVDCLGIFNLEKISKKMEKNPSRYVIIEKGLGKLNHWENDKNAKEW
jgi:hypothetical protein